MEAAAFRVGQSRLRAAGRITTGLWPGFPSDLVSLLTVHEGNVVAVSRALNTRRAQVYRWLRRFGLEVKAFRR